MEWSKILEAVAGSSPMAAVLGYAVLTLWKKLETKDAEIQRLNEARVKDLIEIARSED